MKFRLLVAVASACAFLSCQKTINENFEQPSSQDLLGTYDFVEMNMNETIIQTDTISGIISKATNIDTLLTENNTGTLQVTADKFILANFNYTGFTYTKYIYEVQGQLPQIEEIIEPFGLGDPISYPCDYTRLGRDSISLTNIQEVEDGSVSPGMESNHYRFSGDTLILTFQEKEIRYYADDDRKGSYDETFTKRLKFKRKK
ncbi:hypothetical protein [Flavihumibacter solisilvae]|uniref:Uncharacterized protein n=1 Tax=Flavihumibacter solisilvae TaxID=1349421 RepID=A0A0C1KZD4_9BACT|nr:hypothetical protein [Flavihumibacter solisilvae]KIC92631.1 hypothetical protein OI18_21870 [Flavihumibacter solisilvae]